MATTTSIPSLYFADWNGITRVAPPARFKTVALTDGVRHIVAGDGGVVALTVHGMPTVLDDALAPEGRVTHAPAARLPGGNGHAECNGDALELIAGKNGRTRVALGRATHALGEIELGARRGAPGAQYDTGSLAFGDEGTFATLSPPGRVLIGRLDAAHAQARVDASLAIAPAGGAPVALLPGAGACVIAALDMTRSLLHLARVAADTGAVEIHTTPALSLPARAGDTLVFQRDEGTAVRTALDGTTVRESWAIPPEERGPGQVAARGAEAWFMPLYRESLVDLTRGRAHVRKLPPKTAAPRAYYRELLRRADAIAVRSNVRVHLATVKYSLGRTPSSMFPGWVFESGDGGIHAIAAWGLAIAAGAWMPFEAPGWENNRGGYFGSGSVFHRTSDLDELLALFAALDEHRLPFVHTWRMLEDVYRDALEHPTRDRALTPDAENLALEALLHAVATPERLELAPVVAQWRAEPLTPPRAVALLAPLQTIESWGPRERGLYGIEALLARMFVSQFGARAVPVLAHMVETAPSPYAKANSGHLTGALSAARRLAAG